MFIAASKINPENARLIFECVKKYNPKPLDEIVLNVKKMPKPSSLKLNSNSSTKDPSPEQRNSPGSRANVSSPSFQHAATSITQNLKAKTLKSPTPIMPGGHKRSADTEQSGKNG